MNGTPPFRLHPTALLGAALALVTLAPPAPAQGGSSSDDWPLRGDLFFVEDAFNQERGLFQTNLLAIRWDDEPRDRWDASVSQNWPLGSVRHEFSFTVPFSWVNGGEQNGLEDVRLDYRYLVLRETDARPAFVARIGFLLPTADEEDEQGRGEFGWEVDFPVAKAIGDVYLHLNVGSRSRPDVEPPDGGDDGEHLWTPFLAGSTALRLRPGFNLLLETLAEFQESVTAPDTTERDTRWILSPGLRAGGTRGRTTLVVGAAVPFGLTDATEDVGFVGYLSLELPFR